MGDYVRAAVSAARGAAQQTTCACSICLISIAQHRDRCHRTVDRTQIVGREFNHSGTNILVQAVKLAAAGNRHNPRLLHQQPGQRDLRRCCAFLPGNLSEQVNHTLIRLNGFGRNGQLKVLLWAIADLFEGNLHLRYQLQTGREYVYVGRCASLNIFTIAGSRWSKKLLVLVSSVAIAAILSGLKLKSKTLKFSTIRS